MSELEPDLVEGLSSVQRIVTHDPRDWTANRHDAFIYGVFQGWDDPAVEREVAEKHDWDAAFLDRLHRLNRALTSAIDH